MSELLVLFLAIAENFEAKFYTFIADSYLRKSA